MRVPVTFLACNAALVVTKELTDYCYRNKEFSANTYRELATENPGNFVTCPTSTGISLGMVHSGAKKQTADQLAEGLSLPNNNTAIKGLMEAAMPHLQSSANCYTLKPIHKMYVDTKFELNPHFKRTAIEVFNSSVESVDFKQTKSVIARVNNWIADSTKKHIKDFLQPGDVNESTKAILVNAMSFQGTWVHEFDKKLTKKVKFYADQEKIVEVDMMETTATYEFHKCKYFKATFLKMPYVGKDLNMVIILPYEKDGLAFVEGMIQEALEQDKYDWTRVHVKFPKFKMDTTVKCVPIMEKLGIEDVFKSSADLSGISSGAPFFISNVIERNTVEVNEKGTFAAAATEVVAAPAAAPSQEPSVEYFVNHPFIFYVESPAGIIFIGRYAGQ